MGDFSTNLSGQSALSVATSGSQYIMASIISGEVHVMSGSATAVGMSGLPYWQDASGVVGVTIISSNISVSTSVNSGLFVVVGSGNYMSGIGVQLSGTVAQITSGVVQAYISGVVAVNVSGLSISGVQMALSGTTAQITSGVVQVYLSGGTASLSGLILTSGIFFASGIGITLSGTVVQITSGVVQAYISGIVASTISGTVNIAGQSGLLVPQVLSGWAHSGGNVGHLGMAGFVEPTVAAVRLSGQLAPFSLDISGNLRVSMPGSAISGHTVSLSGTVAQITSGVVQVYLSGGTASLSGLILTSGVFFASGIGITLSGTVAQVTSGVVQVYLSGGTASLSGLILASGLFFSAQVTSGVVTIASGSVVSLVSGITISGHTIRVVQSQGSTLVRSSGATFAVADFLYTAASGGAQLSSGLCAEVFIRNRGNQLIGQSCLAVYIGGSGAGISPASGMGYPLFSGETLTLHVQNLNQVNVVAMSSGAALSYIAT